MKGAKTRADWPAGSGVHLHILVGLIILAWLVSCQMPAPSALTRAAQATPTTASEMTDLAANGYVDSADGRLRVAGQTSLLMSLKALANPPAAPAGWELVGPAFEVTAQDRQRRPVRQLAAAVQLRFDVPDDRPLTVLVYTGTAWQVVVSEVDAAGKLTASVDHLTPYAVGAPVRGKPGAGVTVAPRVTPGRAAASVANATPGANATVAVATTAPTEVQNALASAAKALKNKSVRITSAAGYAGSLYLAGPPALQDSLGAAAGAGGTGAYGLYNAVNEAAVVQASGSHASGSLTLLVEPKTTFPASAADAQKQLLALFPGITAPLTQAQANTTAYVFYGTAGNTAYSTGYVSYNGVPLAYALSGSGIYQSFVPKQ